MLTHWVHRGALCGLALLAVGAVTPPSAAASGACDAPPQAGSINLMLTSGGRARSAIVHVPPAVAPARRLPVVLALHGSAASGAFMERHTGLSSIADAEGFIAVYPNASGPWNADDRRAAAPDDVVFVSDLLDRLAAGWCIDAGRTYAVGVSSGGGMVARLACDLSDRIAAIASVAGAYATLPPCRPRRPVSVLEVHGTADRIVPYNGRAPGDAGSVAAFLRGWRVRDRCHKRPARREIAARTVEIDFPGCARHSAVQHIEIIGGGHQYPGAVPPDAGPRSNISASWRAWRFFAGLPV